MKEKPFLELVTSAPAWRVRRSIRRGADVYARDERGLSTLMLAAATNRHRGSVKALLDAGLDVNTRHSDGWSPLLLAALNENRPAVAAMLIENGARVLEVGARGVTALMLAYGTPGMTALLLRAGADVNARDDAGMTPLMHAASGRAKRQGLVLLLEAGADVKACDRKGMTPLMHAAGGGAGSKELDALIGAGAGVDACDAEGMTALLHAAKNSHVLANICGSMGSLLVDEQHRKLAIGLMVRYGLSGKTRTGSIERLLEVGAQVNAVNKAGDTALLLALPKNERSRVIDVLSSAGVDPDAVPGDDGQSYAEMITKADDNIGSITALLHGGADPNVRDRSGLTPLMRAASTASGASVIERLLQFGADPTVEDPEGRTALAFAGNEEIGSVLFAAAATRPRSKG